VIVDLRTENTFVHALVVCGFSSAVSSVISDDQGPQVFVHLQLVLSAFLVVNFFELVQVHCVHFEVLHVHFVLHFLGCCILHVVGPVHAFLNELVNVFVTELISDFEYSVGTKVYHVLHFILLEAL